ncbi:MAG TPA: SDR family oxidoreductase [bacterium]|nr:SDR family oxidoreductase [bacterium]
MRTWFITGCSTGFGRLLTLACLDRGDMVMATARRQEDLDALSAEAREKPGKLHTAAVDVTSEDDARVAVEDLLTYEGRLDVLVNNAGYGYMATQEEGDLAEIKAMYEVNVFGLIRTTQAVLPHFRTGGGGTIVNLSSVAGRLGLPRGGFYQSTKWAVECLSQSVFFETSRYGVKVRVIEPGAYDTDFGSRSIRIQESLKDGTSPYLEQADAWLKAAQYIFNTPKQDPIEVVAAILGSVDRPEGFLRVPVGRDTLAFLALRETKTDEEYLGTMRSFGYGLGPQG